MSDDQGLSTKVELDDEGKIIKTTLSSKEINLDANSVEQKTASVDQLSTILDPDKNPFTSSGKLSRKADYILSHSTITRTELRISDPDVPSRAREKSDSNAQPPLQNGTVASEAPVEEPLLKPALVNQEEKEPSGLVNGYTGGPVEAEVSQVLLQMPDKDKAEQVKLESRKCCAGCCQKCRQCCIVQ